MEASVLLTENNRFDSGTNGEKTTRDNADFIIPIFHGDDIVVETRVSHLGHKSFTLQQRAINRATGLEVCRCATVMVCFNQRTKQSADIPAEFRQAIEAFEGITSQS